MPLSAGTKLGPNEILAPIGEGGRTLIVNWPALLKQGAAAQ